MSSVHTDKKRLFVSFYVRVGSERLRGRIYPGLNDNREGWRSPVLKQVRQLIAERRWTELAARYPECLALASFRERLLLADDVTTFRQASERFLAYQTAQNEKATVVFYRNVLKNHLWSAGEFADKPLKMIGASDVAQVIGAVYQSGRQATAANMRRTISAIFNWGRCERGSDGKYLVEDNPVTRTKPVTVDRPDEDIDPCAQAEVEAIELAARPGWERRIAIVGFGAGLRVAELFGLKQRDVDLSRRVIRVRQTWTRWGEGGVKNKRARREVDLTPPVIAALREQLAECQRWNEMAKVASTDDLQKLVDAAVASPWLWPQSPRRPTPHNPQNFSRRYWPAILKRAGVKHRELYQMRHTFATLLLVRGAEWRYIADQMGHTDLTMLQKHYWKWRPGSPAKPLPTS